MGDKEVAYEEARINKNSGYRRKKNILRYNKFPI